MGKKYDNFIELCMKEDPFYHLKGNNSVKHIILESKSEMCKWSIAPNRKPSSNFVSYFE